MRTILAGLFNRNNGVRNNNRPLSGEIDFDFVPILRPEDMRAMANNRGWRFKLASHGGGPYIQEQSVSADGNGNYPGMVCYERQGDKIFKKNLTAFGPGDLYCSFWNILSLAGENPETFTPQFSYWKRPEKMDDGGQNLQ